MDDFRNVNQLLVLSSLVHNMVFLLAMRISCLKWWKARYLDFVQILNLLTLYSGSLVSFQVCDKYLLDIQYRMRSPISFIFKQVLSSVTIWSDSPNVTAKSNEKQYIPGPIFGSYSFIDVLSGVEEFDKLGHSPRNMAEEFQPIISVSL